MGKSRNANYFWLHKDEQLKREQYCYSKHQPKNHKYNCVHYGKYYTYANDNNVYGVIRNKEVTEKWASYMALRGGVIQHVSTPAPADDYQDLGTVLAALKKIYADQFQKYSIMYILKP